MMSSSGAHDADVAGAVASVDGAGSLEASARGPVALASRVLKLSAVPVVVLTSVVASSGCLNLLFPGPFIAPADHAPVVTSLTPEPTFKPIEEHIGHNCEPLNRFFADVDDADLDDPLTERFSVQFDASQAGDGSNIADESLLEVDLPRLPKPVDGRNYAFKEFRLEFDTVTRHIGIDTLKNQQADRTQLLELAISDGGLLPGQEVAHDKGQLVTVFSWALKLTAEDCP